MERYVGKLRQLNKMIKDLVMVVENSGKLSAFKRQQKPAERQLKKELLVIIKQIASNGSVEMDLWSEIRNYFIVLIKDILDKYNKQYRDSKTFDDEQQVILQYLTLFDKQLFYNESRPPFTIQRIAQLTLQPERYYKSCRKLLYAYEKLVNVCDPDQK